MKIIYTLPDQSEIYEKHYKTCLFEKIQLIDKSFVNMPRPKHDLAPQLSDLFHKDDGIVDVDKYTNRKLQYDHGERLEVELIYSLVPNKLAKHINFFSSTKITKPNGERSAIYFILN